MKSIRGHFYLLSFPIGITGIIQCVFSFLSWSVFQDQQLLIFISPGSGLVLFGIVLWLIFRKQFSNRIGYRSALLFTTLTWIVVSLFSAIPIFFATHVSLTDSVFESVSALTTTGATILSGLDQLPPTFLLYRQFLQWFGGLGVVVFVVAILPMLNVGGMRLLKMETPGPMKDEKLSPRVAHTAAYLWCVYLVITVLCALSYYLAGMNGFDAIAHSLTTVSTGGFSTHDASMGYFTNPMIFLVSDVFMLIGAISFALHFRVWRKRQFSLYLKDEETRAFLVVVLVLSLLVVLLLNSKVHYHHILSALGDGVFILISFITSTGYGVANYTEWPSVIVFMLIFAGFIGGCAGSTAGGNKMVRNILCYKFAGYEMNRLIHPSAIIRIKFQGQTVDEKVISATISFIFFVVLSTVVFTLLMMATGLDFWSSVTAVAACLNVLGPAFGKLGNNFQPVSDLGTWYLSGAMILGRLEYFTVIALFNVAFWHR